MYYPLENDSEIHIIGMSYKYSNKRTMYPFVAVAMENTREKALTSARRVLAGRKYLRRDVLVENIPLYLISVVGSEVHRELLRPYLDDKNKIVFDVV